jgi:deoxyribose-phosphate aldolase
MKLPEFNRKEFQAQLDALKNAEQLPSKKDLQLILRCIDLTSLEGNDTSEKIRELCHKAKSNELYPAAVCVYPVFIKTVKKQLKGSKIKTATVAGGFPSGQLPLKLKLREVKYAIKQGADEIDFTISRAAILEGNYEKLTEEVSAVKELCGDRTLKVILETGELGSEENIFLASNLALNAGADFIKTSTGKIPVGASIESVCAMLLAISEYFKRTGRAAGIKPSGRISNAEQAAQYLQLTKNILGEDWLNPTRLRFGASRLFDDVIMKLGKAN